MKKDKRHSQLVCTDRGKHKVDQFQHNRGKKRRGLCELSSDSGSEKCEQDSDSDSKTEMGLGSLLNTTSGEDNTGSEDDRPAKKIDVYREKKEVTAKDKYDSTSYRSNLQSAIKDLRSLNFQRSHLKAIKKTPFWLLFDAIYSSDESRLKKRCDKDERTITQIIECYDDLKDRFQIGGRLVELTKRDVQLVFGVISGVKTLSTKSTGCDDPEWIIRCFANEMDKAKGKLVMYKTYLLNKIRELLSVGEGREVDVARLTHCYLLAAVLAPNKNASMPSHVTRSLEEFGGICDYDWCKYVLDMLKSQIGGRTSTRAGGCTMLLPYFLNPGEIVVDMGGVEGSEGSR